MGTTVWSTNFRRERARRGTTRISRRALKHGGWVARERRRKLDEGKNSVHGRVEAS